jgi:hypothetical protein
VKRRNFLESLLKGIYLTAKTIFTLLDKKRRNKKGEKNNKNVFLE